MKSTDYGIEFSGSQPPTTGKDNKFDVSTSYGDKHPHVAEDTAQEQRADVAADMAGFTNPNPYPNKDMDLGLRPNMFPRETGHDSLSEEEVVLS